MEKNDYMIGGKEEKKKEF